MSRMKRVFCGIGFFLSLLATIMFSFVWWERVHMPYNEADRYYAGLVVLHEQAEGIYAFLAVVSFAVTLVFAVIFRNRLHDKDN